MVNFTNAAATAKRLVEANGRSVALVRENRTADTPGEPWRGSSSTPATGTGGDPGTSVLACFVSDGGGLGREVRDAVGQLVTEFDQMCLVAATSAPGVDLERYDRLLDGGVSWKIVGRAQLKPSTTSVLWILALKR